MDPETPEADAAEQARQAENDVDEEQTAAATNAIPEVDANPADLVEQQQVVPNDDEAYEWS